MNYEIEQFNSDEAELSKLVVDLQAIDISNIEEVKNGLKIAKKTRTSITKKGKELRQESNEYSSAVIEREKELVAMIKPEEDRLSDVVAKEDRQALIEVQRPLLPIRREIISKLSLEMTDDAILAMEESDFASLVADTNRNMKKEEFLKSNGFNEKEFICEDKNGAVRIYKLVAETII